ncbi:MAG: TVP38/TMEM64 family protein [Firmicutes bacterium]|nr:TVP38/TMEM64 family protein [Bacillota bacterium]
MGTGIENIKKHKRENRLRLVISILKLVLLAAIVAGIPLYIWLVHGDWLHRFEDVQEVIAFLERYETESIPIYLGFQVLQIVISVLPGQVFQIAAGYMYPFWLALLLALTGAVIGSTITFGLAKLLGQDFLRLFFGEEKILYYIERLNSRRAYTIVFLLYLIPGIPKDVVSYAAGASEMHFKPFLILSAVGRLPGMCGSLLMGNLLEGENYVGLGITAAVAFLAFLFCIIFRQRISIWLDRIYEQIRN